MMRPCVNLILSKFLPLNMALYGGPSADHDAESRVAGSVSTHVAASATLTTYASTVLHIRKRQSFYSCRLINHPSIWLLLLAASWANMLRPTSTQGLCNPTRLRLGIQELHECNINATLNYVGSPSPVGAP